MSFLRFNPGSRSYQVFVLILLLGSCQTDKRNATDMEKQMTPETLFESYYEERLAMNPIHATSIGDPRYNDTLVNFLTDEYQEQLKAFCRKYQQLIRNFEGEELDDNQQLGIELISYNSRIVLEGLENKICMVPSPPYGEPVPLLMPLNQFWSVQLLMSQLASGESIQPFRTVKDYENWLARVDDYIELIDTAIYRMREGMEQVLTQPKIITERMIEQLESMDVPVEAHIFYSPVLRMPDSFTEPEKEKIRDAYRNMVERKIMPAYSSLQAFLQREYLPNCRESSGIGALPSGSETYRYLVRYHTTTDLTPEQIFEMGKKEVARIRSEMEQVMGRVGFEGDLKAFFEYVRNDDNLMPFTEPQQVIDHFNSIYERMKPQLDKLFDLKPETGFEVRRTEAFREKTASAEYVPGSADGSRNGIFYVPIPDVKKYNIFSDEDLFLHEAIPGHHYQISIQQENKQLPTFQRVFIENNAYIEGWALYTESLGKELGLYTDPYQYFGMLSSEMHRAIRLVVDVGIHEKGWTREDAIRYSLENEAQPEASIVSEIERYMVMPGQALSYKIGQFKIRELRSRAEERLGDKFNIKEFHNEILESGSVPLMILEERIDRWIESKLETS